MKYMILAYGSQQDYDAMVGKDTGKPAWTEAEARALGEFMANLTRELAESGELVETRALDAPVHTRRLGGDPETGEAVVTDGPYAETQEVLAGYWIVECDSFDRATEIAARLHAAPGPEYAARTAYADVRPIIEAQPGPEL